MTPSAFPLTIELSTTAVHIDPGSAATVSVTIRNIGEIVQHYEAAVVGLPSQAATTRDTEVIKLRPGESATIVLTITIPPRGIRGGTYLLGVLARSPYQPEVSRAAELTLEVAAVTGVELSVQPTVVEAHSNGRCVAVLSNRGNVPITAVVSADDDQQRARFTVHPTHVQLPPGGQQPVTVRWEAPGFLTGQPKRSTITVRATAGDGTEEARVSFVQPPRLPVGVLTFLGILIAVAVVAGAIIIGAIITRPDDPPTSEPPSVVTTPTSSSSGSEPPEAPSLTLSPGSPLAGSPVTVTADAGDDITSWSWQVTDAGNNVVATAATPKTFTWTPAQPGAFTLHLTIVSEGGETTATLPVEVSLRPVVVAETEIEVNGTATEEVTCTDSRVPVSGGVVTAADSPAVIVRHSAPTADGWTVTLRSSSEATTARLTAVCVTPLPGMTVQRAETNLTAPGDARIEATCPAGQVVVGGGGGLVPGADDGSVQGIVHASWPDRDNQDSPWRHWRQHVQVSAPTTVEVFAVCAPPPPDYTVSIADQEKEGNSTVDLTLTCDGGTLLAAGSALDPHATPPAGSRATVVSSGPVPDSLTGAPASWPFRVLLTLPAPFRLNGYTVCATIAE